MTNWNRVFEALDPVAGKEVAARALAAGQYMTKRNIEEVRPIMDAAKAYLTGSGLLKPGEKAHAYSADDVDLATISRAKVGQSWKVTDEAAFARWLEDTGRETNPWEMRPKARVLTSAYLKLLAESMSETGEIPDGVTVVDTGGNITVRISGKQMDAIAELEAMAGYGEAVAMVTAELENMEGDDE